MRTLYAYSIPSNNNHFNDIIVQFNKLMYDMQQTMDKANRMHTRLQDVEDVVLKFKCHKDYC